ncbi:hypothetical protein L484_022730 [Morus notabilis]|uniref:F-box/kelch-repeat protein SKIP25 n=1 Tax=Morus notabilis TaxID=981085 RepID=W9SK71_9ROSA|nr:F-box/kelch-repeat protein SKIP25 [Morus notabilis]EXC35177.1 hypothetical protein L484_022730 [Morus notabilis]
MSNDISPASKRIKLNPHHQNDNDNEGFDPLLPGLPNHLAQVCLSLLPPFSLFSVCRSWRRLIYTPSFPPFLSLYALFSTSSPHQSLHFRSFDPISSTWHVLPPPPSDPPLRLLLRHPSFVSRNLPIQSLSVAGDLLILAATAADFSPAIPRPIVFHTRGWRWAFGPPLAAPRRWCAAGSLRGSAYVASGIGSQFSQEVARTVERWDLERESAWERVSDLKNGRFRRDAIDAVGWRGKLCMVNVQGGSMKDGVVYDAEKDAWEEMPAGMIGGWRGPAAAMDEEEMFMVDEAKGVLRRYDEERDDWEKVVESERLRGAEQIAAGGGKVCVVCGGGRGIVVVDVVSPSPGRIWEVETPSGLEAVAVHVLPRMSIPVQPRK